MIYLWYPGFVPDSQDIDISEVEDPWDDYAQDLSDARNRIKIRNPNWVTDINKQQNIIVRRSMNDIARTTITRDRRLMNLRFCMLHFTNLRKERRLALEHFILRAEGHYIGYKDPYGICHVILLQASDIVLVQEARAGGGVIPGLETIEDETASVELNIAIARTYATVTIDG